MKKELITDTTKKAKKATTKKKVKKRLTKPKKRHADLLPYKIDTYSLYVKWKSLPTFLRMPDGKMTVNQQLDKLGIDDPEMIELCNIRTQQEFAEIHGVNITTLTEWNQRVQTRDILQDIRGWATLFLKDVMASMFVSAMKTGGFKDRENFFKIVANWNEKLAVEHNAGESLADILKNGLKQRHGEDKKWE